MSAEQGRADATPGPLSSWQVLLAGAVAQVAVAAGALGAATVSGGRLGTLAGGYLLSLVLVAVAAAAVPLLLLRAGRHLRAGGGLSVALGAGVLVVTEFAPVTWALPLGLFLAGALAWREARAASNATR